ncbi:DNA repair protein RadC [Halarcobacter sp.]|uniref:RadC family protein n=1 Tax=Halarcobacter sp. TaxID=2321133 RepID=UPI002AAAF08C|nr:DNA repair protein RadC [Halarcobacter sp.]
MIDYIAETRINYRDTNNKISSANDVYEEVKEFSNKSQEHFITIYLDGANRVLETRVNFIGTLNQSLVHPREIFKRAIELTCASIIIVHNHPSGILSPSDEDINITNRIKEASKILGIELLDHVIISVFGFYSFRSEELL